MPGYHRELCKARCDCGNWAGFLYLITCKRVCFRCLSYKSQYLPLPPADVLNKFGLRCNSLPKIPSMRCVTGRYSLQRLSVGKRTRLYDPVSARRVDIAVHGSEISIIDFVEDKLDDRLDSYMDRVDEYHQGLRPNKSRRPKSDHDLDYEDRAVRNPRRFVAVVRAPYYNVNTATPEWGIYCPDSLCRWEGWKYTEEEYKEHIKQLGRVEHREHVHPEGESFKGCGKAVKRRRLKSLSPSPSPSETPSETLSDFF